jgi:hypothetical protein
MRLIFCINRVCTVKAFVILVFDLVDNQKFTPCYQQYLESLTPSSGDAGSHLLPISSLLVVGY